MASTPDHQALAARWQALLAPFGQPEAANNAFDQLWQRYTEPGRHYHSVDHVAACLRWLDQVRDKVKHLLAVELALWLHDVIYDPKAGDNEAQSARLAGELLGACGVPAATVAEVERLILLTVHAAEPADADGQYLVDIDLSILGADRALYDRYERWIRAEYQHVPGLLFWYGRRRLLRQFLRKPRLYATPFFRERLEATARDNLRRASRWLG